MEWKSETANGQYRMKMTKEKRNRKREEGRRKSIKMRQREINGVKYTRPTPAVGGSSLAMPFWGVRKSCQQDVTKCHGAGWPGEG